MSLSFCLRTDFLAVYETENNWDTLLRQRVIFLGLENLVKIESAAQGVTIPILSFYFYI